MKKLIIGTFVLAIVGIILGLISAILYFINCDSYGAIGVISTIVSILLGIISIVYTYKSGEETFELFSKFRDNLNKLDEQIDTIDKQNHSLVEKITQELSKENYNQNNIDNVRRNRNK